MNSFGSYIREKREALVAEDKSKSLRQVAITIGVEPAFLSKVERDIVSPPSEGKIIALAEVLNEDPIFYWPWQEKCHLTFLPL